MDERILSWTAASREPAGCSDCGRDLRWGSVLLTCSRFMQEPHMASQYQTIAVELSEEGLLRVTLNRPDVRNAINTQMGRDLRAIFTPLVFDAGSVRCAVVTGVGDKAFCAGGDLKERNGMTDAEWRAQHAIFEEAFYAIMDSSVPVIAAVNGAAFGGG